MRKRIHALLLVFVLLAACTGNTHSISVSVQEEITVPTGYTFLDASAYGQYAEIVTYYCINNVTQKVYTCSNGVIDKEIVLPEGYEFVGASAYGRYAEFLTIYCRLKGTERIFKCK
jgi:hypothetical protein